MLNNGGDTSLLLQIIGRSASPSDIRSLHHLVTSSVSQQHSFALSNALAQAYARCGSLDEARSCLDRLFFWNEQAWHLAIRTCARCSYLVEDAFKLFGRALRGGSTVTRFISASILSACCSPANIFEGRLIHTLVASHGFDHDVVVSTALIHMYGRCASLDDALRTFEDMPERNGISWNVIIAVNIEHGNANHSLELLSAMQNQGIVLEKVTFLNAFDACTVVRNDIRAKQLHACIVGSKLESDVMVRTSLMKLYGGLGHIEDARMIFNEMSQKDAISWNALIGLYAQRRKAENAFEVFKEMRLNGVCLNRVTLISLLDACACKSHATMGDAIYDYIVGAGYELDVVLGTSLVNMYGKCNKLKDAQIVFKMMPDRNVVSWNAMMTAYVLNDDSKAVLELFELMKHSGIYPDSVSFLLIFDVCGLQSNLAKGKQAYACFRASCINLDVTLGSSLISMYGRCDDLENARRVFERMYERNAITFINMLSICANLGALDEGKWLHLLVIDSEVELDVVMNTALINMYGKCGLVNIAWDIFQDMPERNILSWNSMISAYTQQGQGKTAMKIFDYMRMAGIVPDESTFISMLSACSHSGLLDEGFYYFMLMYRFYNIQPLIDHYNCLVDMLGRAGMTDDAEKFMESVSFTPSVVSWATLIGAWQNQIDVDWEEKGRKFFLSCNDTD